MDVLTMIGLVLSALLAENLVMVYCMGIGTSESAFTNPIEGRRVGIAVTLVMVISAVISRYIDFLLLNLQLAHLSLLAFVLLVPTVAYLLQVFLRTFFPELSHRLALPLRNSFGNAAVLGVVLLASQRGYSVQQTFIFSFFGGVGVTLALISFAGLTEEIRLDRCPQAFRGLPIHLVTAGLMALTMVGYYGLHIG